MNPLGAGWAVGDLDLVEGVGFVLEHLAHLVLSGELGQQFYIENIVGATGNVGAAREHGRGKLGERGWRRRRSPGSPARPA